MFINNYTVGNNIGLRNSVNSQINRGSSWIIWANFDKWISKIIYEIFDDIKQVLKGLYKKEYEKVEIGKAEVRQIFKYSKAGKIAGCYVTEGMVKRDSLIEIFRNKKRVFEGQLTSLKRFKDDVKEVKSNYECGIVIDEFQDYEEGDRLVFLELREIPF